jgi:hypothetical protein
MKNKINLPRFASEFSLVKESKFYSRKSNYSESKNNNIILSSACGRLLKRCLAGKDPKSHACNHWVIYC